MRKTKIVCTLGPSSCSEKKIKEMALAGMDVARLNFSHGDYAFHENLIKTVRRVSGQIGKPLCILQDLQGPKLRVGELNKGKIHLKAGEIFVLTSKPLVGDERRAFVSYPYLAQDAKPGDRILLADGVVILQVQQIKEGEVFCKVEQGGYLKSHQGVNLPGINLRISALTEKDKQDLAFGVAQKVDWVALSFVRKGFDLLELKAELSNLNSDIPVIAKLEKPEALENLEEIMNLTDGIMVARGDLGVEIPLEQVPHAQKELIRKSRFQGKPVITATQMLESMTRSVRPTRAEVSDVANAILDGTDAIMLSEETASGEYPVEAVAMMAKIAETTEQYMPYEQVFQERCGENLLEILSLAACEISENLKTKAIVVGSTSGRTARVTSSFRPRCPIIAASEDETTVHRLMLSWGVFPQFSSPVKTTEELNRELLSAAKKSGLVEDGDLVLLTAGFPPGVTGSTNTIRLMIPGELFLRGVGVGEPDQVVQGRLRLAKNPNDALGKVKKGDILLIDTLDERYKPVLSRVTGVIAMSGGSGTRAERLLKGHNLPGILGVAGAFKIFKDNDMVKLDIQRGLVSKKQE